MSKKEKVRTITVGGVFSWIFGAIFLLSGFGSLVMGNWASGIVYVITGVIIVPITNAYLEKNANFKISGGLKVLIAIVAILVAGFLAPDTSEDFVVKSEQAYVVPSGYKIIMKEVSSVRPWMDYIVEVIGEVKNEGDKFAQSYNAKVTITCYDKNDKMVGTDFTYAEHPMNPGDVAPFKAYVDVSIPAYDVKYCQARV